MFLTPHISLLILMLMGAVLHRAPTAPASAPAAAAFALAVVAIARAIAPAVTFVVSHVRCWRLLGSVRAVERQTDMDWGERKAAL